MTVEVQVKKQKAKDSMMLKMETDVYMLHYKNWIEESRHWKIKRSRLYALILMHCPPDLEEILRTMSAWTAVSNGYNVIGLLKMVHDVAHDQTEAKQTVMGFVQTTVELCTYHQDESLSYDN